MRWLQTEYLLKGVYLGLLLYAALRQGEGGDAATGLLSVNLPALAGIAVALIAAGVSKAREGYRAGRRPLVYLLFLMLESPGLVYAGTLLGTLIGAWFLRRPDSDDLLLPLIAGGALLGAIFSILRQIPGRDLRLGLTAGLAVALVVGGMAWLGLLGIAGGHTLVSPMPFAWQLLLSIPLFYVLTFSGHAEESEAEIGAICALMGLALAILTNPLPSLRFVGFLVPVATFFWYTTRVLPALRVLKHAFRGLGYAKAGRPRRALQAFRRALQLDPNNNLAREGFWDLHRSLDVRTLAQDPETLELVDLSLCLERVGTLLIGGTPTQKQLEEADRLLDLILALKPSLLPAGNYWRAVARTHGRQYDEAAALLAQVLDPTIADPGDVHRAEVLLPAWRLALTVEPLKSRVGLPQLALPGRRLEAILACERFLVEQPNDSEAWTVKRFLYHEVTEAEYNAAAGGDSLVVNGFDHAYVQQLGLAMIDDNSRWQRGGEYLRLAARGMPTLGPTLFVQIAQAQQRAGHGSDARHNYELAKRAGLSVGQKNLADTERQAYFATLKVLAEDAMARGDLDDAVDNYHLYTESERSGVETLRTLAELHERRGDPLSALRATDQALIYNGKDKDLLERKDRYYYSVLPDHLRARIESVRAGFDFDYCLRRTRTILDGRYEGLEWLDVARHLVELALIVRPESLPAKVLQARVLLRFGERQQALDMLETVRGPALPEKFASRDDEEAWYLATQLLGDLYLETNQPERAIACLQDFRKSSKSGAKTLYKLGQAFEQLGDSAKAVRCYRSVTAYEDNPLAPDAYDALHRLEA